MEVTKELARKLSSEMSMLCSEIAKRHGLKILPRGGRLTDGGVILKFELAPIGANGETMTQFVTAFKKLAPMYGLKAGDLNRKVVINGRQYTISGLRTSAHRYPVLAVEKTSGKTFKFPAQDIRKALGRGVAGR